MQDNPEIAGSNYQERRNNHYSPELSNAQGEVRDNLLRWLPGLNAPYNNIGLENAEHSRKRRPTSATEESALARTGAILADSGVEQATADHKENKYNYGWDANFNEYKVGRNRWKRASLMNRRAEITTLIASLTASLMISPAISQGGVFLMPDTPDDIAGHSQREKANRDSINTQITAATTKAALLRKIGEALHANNITEAKTQAQTFETNYREHLTILDAQTITDSHKNEVTNQITSITTQIQQLKTQQNEVQRTLDGLGHAQTPRNHSGRFPTHITNNPNGPSYPVLTLRDEKERKKLYDDKRTAMLNHLDGLKKEQIRIDEQLAAIDHFYLRPWYVMRNTVIGAWNILGSEILPRGEQLAKWTAGTAFPAVYKTTVGLLQHFSSQERAKRRAAVSGYNLTTANNRKGIAAANDEIFTQHTLQGKALHGGIGLVKGTARIGIDLATAIPETVTNMLKAPFVPFGKAQFRGLNLFDRNRTAANDKDASAAA